MYDAPQLQETLAMVTAIQGLVGVLAAALAWFGKLPGLSREGGSAVSRDTHYYARVALFLIASVLVSLIATYSFIFAGRPTLSPPLALLIVSFVQIVAAVILIRAARLGNAAEALAWLCLGAFISLLLSPVGSPGTAGPPAHGVADILVPLLVIVALGASAVVHVARTRFGRLPHDTRAEKRDTVARPLLWALAITACIVASLRVGWQLAIEAASDPASPVPTKDQEPHVIAITALPRYAQVWSWQAENEMALAAHYWLALSEQLTGQEHDHEDMTADPPPESGLPRWFRNAQSSEPPDLTFSRVQEPKHSDSSILRAFDGLRVEAQQTYLQERLLWIHPVSVNPGIVNTPIRPLARSAAERWKLIEPYRLEYASYGMRAVKFDDKTGNRGPLGPKASRFIELRSEIRHAYETIFPKLLNGVLAEFLRAQLLMGADKEASVAIREYISYHRSQATENTHTIFTQFEALDLLKQSALAVHVAPLDARWTDDEVKAAQARIDALAALAACPLDAPFRRIATTEQGELISAFLAGLESGPAKTQAGAPQADAGPAASPASDQPPPSPPTDPSSTPPRKEAGPASDLLDDDAPKDKGPAAPAPPPHDRTSPLSAAREWGQAAAACLPNTTQRNNLRILLDRDGGEVSTRYLLSGDVGKFARLIADLPQDQQVALLSSIRNPSAAALKDIAAAKNWPEPTRRAVTALLDEFAAMSSDEQDRLVYSVGAAVLGPGGAVPDDALSVLLSAAARVHAGLPVVTATVLVAPLFLLAILFAALVARHAGAYMHTLDDLSKALVASERPQTSRAVGREPVIERVKSLISKGWGTIGIVGLRGSGKTRLLHDIASELASGGLKSAGTVKPADGAPSVVDLVVSIHAPTQFTEVEFVTSLRERIASAAEETLARAAGARSSVVRRFDVALLEKAGWASAVLIAATALCYLLLEQHMPSYNAAVAWTPLLIVLLGAVILWAIARMQVAPVDLSRWLERSGGRSSVLASTYREVRDVLHEQVGDLQEPPGNAFAYRTIIFVAIFLFPAALLTLMIALDEVTNINEYTTTALLVAFSVVFFIAFAHGVKSRRRVARGTPGLMQMLQDYRQFTGRLAARLHDGVLSGSPGRLVVCIDELDKIVDWDQTREFLRKVKGVFEIRHVIYLVSMASDAFSRMTMQGAMTKDELDSSFDHVLRLEALTLEDSVSLANAAFSERALKVPAACESDVAFFAAGLPRDIIRGVDEVAALPTNGAAGWLLSKLHSLIGTPEPTTDLTPFIGALAPAAKDEALELRDYLILRSQDPPNKKALENLYRRRVVRRERLLAPMFVPPRRDRTVVPDDNSNS